MTVRGPETGSAGQSAAPCQYLDMENLPAFGPVPSVLGDMSLNSAERQSKGVENALLSGPGAGHQFLPLWEGHPGEHALSSWEASGA